MFPVAKTFILPNPQRFQWQNIFFCVIHSAAESGFLGEMLLEGDYGIICG